MSSVLVVGGTSGIGREIARHFAAAGDRVTLTGRQASRAAAVAKEIGGDATGVALDLAVPHGIAPALAGLDVVDNVVLAAIDREVSTRVHDFDIDLAQRLVTLKLVGYPEVVHALRSRLAPDAAIVMFGGLAMLRPYPGSNTVSTVNGGVIGLMNTLIVELAPIRVNVIHPGITGDSPYWEGKPPAILEGHRSKTITGKLATMAEIVDATRFLLENESMDGVDLAVDNGRLMF